MNQPNWPHFTLNAILNPIFDDCPFLTWESIPEKIQKNLIGVMNLIEDIRTNVRVDGKEVPIQLNSTYRQKDNKSGSPHGKGCAIDMVPVHSTPGWQKAVMDYLKTRDDLEFRVFWEWSGKSPEGWIHVDVGFKKNGKFWIGFPKKGKMAYLPYTGTPPMRMAA